MTNSTTAITFVPSLTEINKDTDVIAADVVAMGKEGILYFVNEAIDNRMKGEIFVVDGNMELATNVAAVLNAQYGEEMALMNDANIARKEVEEVAAAQKDTAALRSNATAKKFLKDQAAKLANAKVSSKKNKSEGETEMTNTTEVTKEATSIRRKSSAKTKGETSMKTVNETAVKETAAKETAMKEKGAAIKEKHAAKKEKAATGRTSSTVKKEVATQAKAKVEAGKMGRDEPQGQTKFVKFEGPWYLNASRYDVLNRLVQIIEDRADMTLGITAITFSSHEQIQKYKNKRDLVAVEQFQSSGAILDFPIKLNAMGDKVTSPSIGWVEWNGKRYPRFGFYRPNTLSVDFTCSCGTKNTGASNENMYCSGCKKVWADLDVTVGEYGFDFDLTGSLDMDGKKKDGTPWLFQEIPNMKVSEETLVLALALAHFDQGLDMWDLPGFEEDAE